MNYDTQTPLILGQDTCHRPHLSVQSKTTYVYFATVRTRSGTIPAKRNILRCTVPIFDSFAAVVCNLWIFIFVCLRVLNWFNFSSNFDYLNHQLSPLFELL